jgi:hypothetical protein
MDQPGDAALLDTTWMPPIAQDEQAASCRDLGYRIAALPAVVPVNGVAAERRATVSCNEALRNKDMEIAALRLQIQLQRGVSMKEFHALQSLLKLAKEETQLAYEDAARANNRAAEAESWLRRMEDALRSAFGQHGEENRSRKFAARRTGSPPLAS